MKQIDITTSIQRYFQANTIIGICILYYVLMALITPGFFSVSNSWNLVYNFIPLLIIAVGQTFVILTAGIDLSVTSIVAVTSVVGGYLMSADTSIVENATITLILGVAGMLITGGVIGGFNGIAVARLKMPAFMVTLTSLMFFSGLAIWLTKSQSIYNLPTALVDFPYKTFLGIPLPVYLGALVLTIAYYILNKSLLGEWIYAVGVNYKTSWLSGVNISYTIVIVYVISGICAATGSLIYTARLETGSPVMGQNILLDVIGAVIIGGTSLYGGKGKLQWTVAGAFLMTMLDNSLNLFGLSFFLIMIIKGAIILLTALFNQLKGRELVHA